MGAVGAIVALVWAQTTRTPWPALGFARPASWPLTIVGGIALGVALKLVVKAVALPLLGAPAQNTTYAALADNPALLIELVITTIVVGGIAEEIFWRGLLFRLLRNVFGEGTGPTIAIVAITTIAFASAHYPDQGLPGVEQALFTGATFGIVFATTRLLWPVMLAHAAYDVVAIVLIYLGLEDSIAHLFFR